MSLTIVEHCLPCLHKLTFGNKNTSSVQNCQLINQKISYEGQKKEYIVCPSLPSHAAMTSCGMPSPNGRGSHGGLVVTLERLREPLAEFQEKRGLPKTEQYGFVNLVTSLCQHAYNAVLVIFSMLYNLLPLLEGFLYLARFFLDKSIEICRTEEKTDKILKIILFIGEMVVVLLMVMVICGFILFPVWYLFSNIFSKIWTMLISTGGS